jgi:hypothetical protein
MARQARIALAISMMARGCAMVSRLPANVRRSQNAKGLPKLAKTKARNEVGLIYSGMFGMEPHVALPFHRSGGSTTGLSTTGAR